MTEQRYILLRQINDCKILEYNMSIYIYIYVCKYTNKLTHNCIFYFLLIISGNILIVSIIIIYNNNTNSNNINNNITLGDFLIIQIWNLLQFSII